MTEKFKISGIGLDTTNLDFELDEELSFDYIHTSISSNIGYRVKAWSKNTFYPIITSINFLNCSQAAIAGHLEELGRDKIDLLLVNANCDFEKYQEEVSSLLETKLVEEIGIKNPESVEQLEKLRELFKFRIVAMDICPLNFNYDVVKWCEDNQMLIFGFNPFGGYINAANTINSFTVPYLLNFAAAHTDILFLSGREPYAAELSRQYLSNLIGKEITDSKLYQIKKSINKLGKPLKTAIRATLVLDENTEIPSDSTDTNFYSFGPESIKLSLGEVSVKFTNDAEKSDIEKEILALEADLNLPADSTCDGDVLSVILPAIKRSFVSKGYLYQPAKIGSNSYIIAVSKITTTKKFIKKTENVDTNIYAISFSGDVFSFQKINFSSLIG